MSAAASLPALPPMQPLPAAVGKPAAAPNEAAARKAAQDFEAVFINELLSHMDQGLSTRGAFDGGQAEGVYKSLFDDAVAKQIAERGGIGIADNIYREILKLQEAKEAASPTPLPKTEGTP